MSDVAGVSKSNRAGLTPIGILVAVLVGLAWWVADGLRSSKIAAETAADQVIEARGLADAIVSIRNQPRRSSLEIEPPSRLTQRVTDAAAAAELSLTALVSLDPQSPSRIGRTDYEQRVTLIVLTDLSLRQFALFARALADAESGLMVRDVVLTARADDSRRAGQDRWDCRLTLTQLIYSPISRR